MNVIEEKKLLIGYEFELEINKQLYEEKYITYRIYQSVANMILKDINATQNRLDTADTIA